MKIAKFVRQLGVDRLLVNIQDNVDRVFRSIQAAIDTISGSIATSNTYRDNLAIDQHDPTGFADTYGIGITGSSQTVTIWAVSGSTNYYIDGTKYTLSNSASVTIPDTEGNHYIYLSASTLTASTTFSADLISDYAYCANLYWDATNNKVVTYGRESHGLMDSATHTYLHNTIGCAYDSGLSLGNMTVDGDGSSNTHAQFSVADGVIRDEDIKFSITDGFPQDLSTVAKLPIWYKTGAGGNWRKKDADTYPLIQDGAAGFTGTGRCAYNQYTGGSWTLTEVGNTDFFLVHYFATNDVFEPIVGILGENEYATQGTARAGATTEINTINTAGLPVAEYVPIATVIFQTADAYSNAVKARIRSTDDGSDYVDLRSFNFSTNGAIAISDHGALTGLDDDDHLQYLNLNGRTDVQVLSASLFITGNVGIGTSSPDTELHIHGASYPYLIIESANANGGGIELKSSTGAYDMYLQGADLRFWDGKDRITFMSGGNVGIGTTSPSGGLHIHGHDYPLVMSSTGDTTDKRRWRFDINGQELRLQALTDADAWASGPMTWNHDGAVGIGTSPSYDFHVDGGGVGSQNIAAFFDNAAGDNTNHFISIGKAYGDETCIHIGHHYDNDGATSSYSWITNGGDDSTQGITLKNGGNVGIGTTTPEGKLEISTPSDIGVQAVTIDQNDADKPFIDFQGTTGANATATISTLTTPGSLTGFIQIEINGTKYWMPYYGDPS